MERGLGDWDVGRGTWDSGTRGLGDAGTWGVQTRGRGDAGIRGRGREHAWGLEDVINKPPDFCAEFVKYNFRWASEK